MAEDVVILVGRVVYLRVMSLSKVPPGAWSGSFIFVLWHTLLEFAPLMLRGKLGGFTQWSRKESRHRADIVGEMFD